MHKQESIFYKLADLTSITGEETKIIMRKKIILSKITKFLYTKTLIHVNNFFGTENISVAVYLNVINHGILTEMFHEYWPLQRRKIKSHSAKVAVRGSSK